MDNGLLKEFVLSGIKASSPDNSQPWKFSLAESQITLFLDPACLGMFFDANHYASLLGCGGVIENIRLTAELRGYKTLVESFAPNEPDFKVAHLRFVPVGKEDKTRTPDELVYAISKRCTHRGFYFRDERVEESVINTIQAAISGYKGAYVRWFNGEKRQEIVKILSTTDRLRYTHEPLHHDFYSKLRFGDQISIRRDGLAADTLGLESLFCYSLPLLKSWRFARILNTFGMHYFMAFRGAKIPLLNANKIGALVMNRGDSILDQGAALQRLWLAVNRVKGLHFQPFGAFPLFIYRMKELNGEGFTDKQKQFLQEQITQLETLIGCDGEAERVVILFRLGYAPEPVAYARRRAIESFLIE